MNLNGVYTKALNAIKLEQPFVVYRKPNSNIVKGFFQKDKILYELDNFESQSGFVFSSFSKQKKYIIPKLESDVYECLFADLEIEDFKSFSLNDTNYLEKENSFKGSVKNAIESINGEELQKVVLSESFKLQFNSENVLDVFNRMVSKYTNALVYVFYHPEIGGWLGATPELFFNLKGKNFSTVSLAGTQLYNDPENVSWGEKEKEEQDIVTSYIVNNSKPYVDNINVFGPSSFRAGNLLHLKSEIRGEITELDQVENIINTLHPTPAVCGLPKREAQEFILNNESYNRTFYTGYLGELNISLERIRNSRRRNFENNIFKSIRNETTLFVNLRCLSFKDSKAQIYVGAGITKDSDPNKEWEEILNKAQTMLSVLG